MNLENEDVDMPSMLNASVIIRGKVIAKFSFLEAHLDAFLSYHFAKNQIFAIELVELLFSTNKITFDSKKALAFQIMSKHYKETILEYKNYNRDMSSIAEQRNIFAHQHLKIDLASKAKFALDGTLVFTKNQVSEKFEEYNEEKIQQLNDLVNVYILLFNDLLKQQGTPSP